jgi:hypothetical protein
MARNYQKDSGGGDYYPYPTPTPEPGKKNKTRTPTMSPTATGYAIRGRDRTPTPTPWPPKMYGTPIPEYLEYLGYPMGVREMGGGSGFGYNGTGGGGGIASKRMSKGGSGIYSVPEKDNSRGYRSSRTNQNSMPAYNPNRPNYTPGTINPNKPYYTPNPNYNPVRMSSGSRGAMKSMSKADNPNPTPPNPYTNSGMYDNARGMSTLPSRSDAYISYVSGARGSKLKPEQRGRMMASTLRGVINELMGNAENTSSKINSKVNNSIAAANSIKAPSISAPNVRDLLSSLSTLAPLISIASAGSKLKNTDTYRTAAENAKHEIRGIQMLPKAVRAANQSVLDELNGRSVGDYAIDRVTRGAKSRYNSAVDTTSNALSSGWKQRKEEYKNMSGIGELIGAADELGLNEKKRKELLDAAGASTGRILNNPYNPANMISRQIPNDIKSRGVSRNLKRVKNIISDFIVNSGRKASAAGGKALADAGSSISNWFDKSATSSRGSRSMSKSLKSNKRSNKYF